MRTLPTVNSHSFAVFGLLIGAIAAQAQPPGGAGGPIQQLQAQVAVLTSQVSTLQDAVTSLQSAVAKLNGQVTAADLVGTYAGHGIQNEFDGNNLGFPTQVASYVYVGTFTLAADGTVTGTNTSAGNNMKIGPPSSVGPIMPSGGNTKTFTSTWSYSNGVLTVAGGAPPFSVAAGGRVLIGASANNSDGTDVILILTRLE